MFIHRIQLLERFYDPLAGEIYVRIHRQHTEVLLSLKFFLFQLDGELINELNVQEYRKHLALVSQEPTLYAGTVRFNILLGATKPEEEVTQEEIEDACRKANILEFIEGLPQYVDRWFIYFIFSQTSLASQGLRY